MDRALKNIAIYVLIVLLAVFAIKFTSGPDEPIKELSEPEFYNLVVGEQVASAQVQVDELVYEITGELKDGSKYSATVSRKPI